MPDFDRRKAPWLINRDREATFETLQRLARQGLMRKQIAAELGTTDNALCCYMSRYGITMKELREQS